MKNMISAVAVLGILAAVAPAQSQRNWDFTPYNYTFRGGLAFTHDAAVAGDNSWVQLGVDFDFNTSILRVGDSYFSVDVLFNDAAGDTFIFPIMLNNRFYTDPMDQRLFLIAGLGAVWAEMPGSSEVVFGARFGAGFNVGNNVVLQGTYTFAGKINGVNPSHSSFTLGYRF
jgi:hypothetical protein